MEIKKTKVYITGMGIWSCIGQDLRAVQEKLRRGNSSIRRVPERAAYGYQSDLAGIPPEVTDELLRERRVPRQMRCCMGEPARYAFMAVDRALLDASLADGQTALQLHPCNRHRVGLIVSNDSTAGAVTEANRTMEQRGDSRAMGAYQVFQTLNSTVSMTLCRCWGINGYSLTLSGACAGGGYAIGLGKRLIEDGTLDRVIVVGAQETNKESYAAFDALGLFATAEPSCNREDDDAAVKHASRPFDKHRRGLVPSGGAACVVLESEASMHERGANPWAELLGVGECTGNDIVSPQEEFLAWSMWNAAKQDSRRTFCSWPKLDLIAAHATGTLSGDLAEGSRIARICDAIAADGAALPYVVATKSVTGHECWMSGVSQVVYSLLQMAGGFVAGHPGLEELDPALSSLNIAKETRYPDRPLQLALCNAFGFGGTHASLLLSRRKENKASVYRMMK